MKSFLEKVFLMGLFVHQSYAGLECIAELECVVYKTTNTYFSLLAKNLQHMILGKNLLHLACAEGDLEGAKSLLLQGYDKEAPDMHGRTPLYTACQYGQREVAKMLLSNGVNKEHRSLNDITSLFVACAYGHSGVVELLLSKGAERDSSCNGVKPWFIAATNGHVTIVKLLLTPQARPGGRIRPTIPLPPSASIHYSPRASDVSLPQRWETDSWGSHLLSAAVAQGDFAVVKTLLLAGANPEQPLLDAAEQGKVEIVKLLLLDSRNANKVDKYSRTPLYIAALNGHLNVVKAVLTLGADTEIAGMRFENKPLYMDEGGCDWGTCAGWTPLYVAAARNHREIVKLLFEAGADAWTPLFIAAGKGYPRMVRLLLDFGVDMDLASSSGWTPLFVAAAMGHLEVVRVLLQAGADVERADKFDRTPLSIATQNGHIKVVEALKERKGSTDKVTSSLAAAAALTGAEARETEANRLQASLPKIMYPRWKGAHLSVPLGEAKLLDIVGAKACFASHPRSDNDAVAPAARKGHREWVQLLLASGASRDTEDKNGVTTLGVASGAEIISLLSQVAVGEDTREVMRREESVGPAAAVASSTSDSNESAAIRNVATSSDRNAQRLALLREQMRTKLFK